MSPKYSNDFWEVCVWGGEGGVRSVLTTPITRPQSTEQRENWWLGLGVEGVCPPLSTQTTPCVCPCSSLVHSPHVSTWLPRHLRLSSGFLETLGPEHGDRLSVTLSPVSPVSSLVTLASWDFLARLWVFSSIYNYDPIPVVISNISYMCLILMGTPCG